MTVALAAPEGFAFIVTYGRSGSTLLQKLLNEIPGYCIRGENANGLFRIFQAWQALTKTKAIRALRQRGAATGADHPWYGGELIDPYELGLSLTRTFVDQVLHLPEGTRVGGFKEIRWHAAGDMFPDFMRFVHAHFPNVKVIVNTRNLDAVARSGWWASQDPAQVKELLGSANAMFETYRKEFPSSSIALHYDDYAGNPDAFASLFDFLGEPFDHAAVRKILDTPLTHLKVQREPAT